MTNLNKSIRHEMSYYGPGLRSGHYGAMRHTVGDIPDDFKTIKSVCCDVSDGIVTDIRLYGVGDSQEARDYHGESIEITEPVESYLRREISWDEMISEIEAIVIAGGESEC